jgi:hypothetical protein
VSDYAAAEIWIGGKIPRRLAPKLCQAIRDEGVALEWGDSDFLPTTLEELLTARKEIDGVLLLRLCNDEIRGGEFDTLESFCVHHRISFRRQSEGTCQWDPEIVEYRPGIGRLRYPTNHCGKLLVRLEVMANLADRIEIAVIASKRHSAAELRKGLREIQTLMQRSLPVMPTPLEPFEIIGRAARKEAKRGR